MGRPRKSESTLYYVSLLTMIAYQIPCQQIGKFIVYKLLLLFGSQIVNW